MRISIRDSRGRRLAAIPVDAARPPSVLHVPVQDAHAGTPTSAPPDQELFLNWDRALDDRGHLRRCPICGCEEFYARKDLPQVTGLVALVLASVLAMALFGIRGVAVGLTVLGVVAAVDLTVFLFARWRLVCYGCSAEFFDVPAGEGHRRWDSRVAEKHRSRRAAKVDPPTSADPSKGS